MYMYHSSTMTAFSKCKICGESAKYSYYGAIVCQSCKMFFKRNAETRQGLLKCSFRNDCHINKNNRHVCSSCRLTKCFRIGMHIEMIRSSRQRKNKQRKPRTSIDDRKASTSMDLTMSYKQKSYKKTSIFYFLETNHLTLNTDQSNLLSSLVDCFDAYDRYSLSQHFLNEQNALPIKLRFKFSVVKQYLILIKTNIELVFRNHQHFLSLSFHDRQILLRTTVEHTTTLGALFTIRQHRLFASPIFSNSIEMIFGSKAVTFAKQIVDRLDPDDTFIKLIMTILFFSTTHCAIYNKCTSISMMNVKAILSIQNLYIELAWQYTVYKYGYNEAVRRFLNLVQCLLLTNNAIVEAHESQQFLEIINIVMKQAEQGLYL